MKRCAKCGQDKDESQFTPRKRRPQARHAEYASYCKVCSVAYQRQRRATWGRDKKRSDAKLREADRVKSAAWRLRLKNETIAAYGGKCECCGESTWQFLCIDHINGGGTKERRITKKGGVNFYSQLKRQGWPPGYRILCHNCNQALGFYHHCPHQDSGI